MKIRIALTFLIALPLFASDEMRKLDFLVGEWKGEATVQMGPGKSEHVQQTERVQSKLGGKLIVIDGLGKKDGEVAHEALGIISWDEAKKAYRFDAWTAREGYVQARMDIGENNTATWGFDTPQGGKVRYTIRLTEKGEWNEIGEFSRDGERWMKFFEMTLAK